MLLATLKHANVQPITECLSDGMSVTEHLLQGTLSGDRAGYGAMLPGYINQSLL